MPAGVYDFHVEQGVQNTFVVEYKNPDGTAKDLTPYSLRGQVKLKMSDPAALANFSFNILDALNGKFEVVLTAESLKAHTFKSQDFKDKVKAVYDIEMYKNNADEDTIRVLNGYVYISPEVTK